MNDDTDWVDALAGRPRVGADPATLREATLLREAVLRWPITVPPDLVPSPADTTALVQRAAAAGLLEPRRTWCAGCAERWRRWLGRPLWLGAGGGGLVLAAVLAAFIVLPGPGRPPPTEDRVLRAPADGVWMLRAADARARRDALAEVLSSQGVEVRRYERLGRFGLDAELPLPVSAPLRDRLLKEGVAPAADGSLRVEVERSPP